MLPCDWPAGSVRRATEQLEQKLKQEMEMAATQRSPLHSPASEHPPPLRASPSAEHPLPRSPTHHHHHHHHSTELRITQGEITAAPKSKDRERSTGSKHEPQRLDSSGTDALPDPSSSSSSSFNSNLSQVSGAIIPVTVHASIDSHMLMSPLASAGPVVESSLNTSVQLCSQNQQCQTPPQASSALMTVDGVTAQETDTDESAQPERGGSCDPESRLARGCQELERIQQTLRELQAFLHEGVGLETAHSEAHEPEPEPEPEPEHPQGLRDAMDTEPEEASPEQTPQGPEVGQRPRKRREGKSFLEASGWHRAMELEARIRQAGLTPPSLMKRSASLAKLDCLELSANDLSDLDLRPHARPTSSHSQDSFNTSPSHPDDTWKKQKVLAGNTCGKKTHPPCGGCDDDDSFSSSSPPQAAPSSPPRLCPKEETAQREEPEGSGGGGGGVVVPSRQQGRGHSSRRPRKASAEKKQRAVTVLYNTM